MATENPGPAGNGQDDSSTAIRAKRRTTGREQRRTTVHREEANGIEPARKPRRNRPPGAAPASSAEVPTLPTTSSDTKASALQRADSDPWTVPQSVRDRFVQDGHRFYFPDGAAAFRDLGRKLTTASENTQVVRSLIEIAHSRGWTEVTVTGTERFRQEAWRQARLAGLGVRGYRPADAEQAQLIRALGRTLLQHPSERDVIAADGAIPATPAREAPPRADSSVSSEPRERIAGTLLEHGRDAYRHDPNEEPSYFVRLKTRDGTREVWGKDIERAITSSLTQPRIGDQVILEKTGREAVTVKRQERGSDGKFHAKEAEVFRNRWVIEKQSFFDARAVAAQTVRDETIGPREAVRQHPQLAGTYLNLRAAELASRALRDPEDQRRFLAQVRGAIADSIERGEPLTPVRLRERTLPKSKERAAPVRE